MNKKTIIVDYGVGNLGSVQNALVHLGKEAKISNDPKEIASAEIVILPGQGAFQTAMDHLRTKNLIDPITNHIQAKKPFLGICVGFQVLFEESEEMGNHKGLGLFPGTLKKFKDPSLKIPHMGWNQLHFKNNTSYEKALGQKAQVYFVHSYYLDQTPTDLVLANTDYGQQFVAAIQRENLLATQFHPEKSGDVGLSLLDHFFKTLT